MRSISGGGPLESIDPHPNPPSFRGRERTELCATLALHPSQERLMSDHTVTTVEQLEALYGLPAGAAVWKEIDHINNGYRAFIEAAPFVVLASNGPEGVDV